MIKRLAAAVLLAIVNLMSSANAGASVIDTDDDGDFAGDTVAEYRKDRGHPGHHDAMAVAARAFDESLDAAWVVRDYAENRAAAATVRRAGEHLAAITLAVQDDCPEWPMVLGRALKFCREGDALKVIVEVDGIDTAPVCSVIETSGFRLARMSLESAPGVLVYYTDLYWTDETPLAISPSHR